MMSRGIHIWVSAIMEPLGSLIRCKFQAISIAVHRILAILFNLIMDISQENCNEDLDSLSKDIPVLSEYTKGLETHVKRRYLQKISLVGVDPASIPSDQFDPECLPSIEATDLVSYVVLETNYYTKEQLKCSKSLEAYNQMASRFVTSVQGRIIVGKHVVVGKVRRSQRMNDPLVNIWVITESDGTILALQNVVVKCAKEF